MPLTQIINKEHENVKYLKGAKFTENVVAVPDITEAVKGATMVCFCLPHQFLKPLMPKIAEAVAPGARGSCEMRAKSEILAAIARRWLPRTAAMRSVTLREGWSLGAPLSRSLICTHRRQAPVRDQGHRLR